MSETDIYSNPLVERYASKEMVGLFSPDSRYSTWRRLWAALARSQKELGLNITDGQLEEMDKHLFDIDYKAVAKYEKSIRHDVMAHLHTFADAAPSAAGILHLGATSCFITDNADLILNKQAVELIAGKLTALLRALEVFCEKHKNQVCLGWTHFQPAQLTTVGKRASLWAQDLLFDLDDLIQFMKELSFRGVKGTTGTQASFLELFDGDYDKVRKLDLAIARHFGFARSLAVCGQTYTRKIDQRMIDILSRIAGSAAKFAHDIRLLMHLREMEEPFGKKQVGSSAMAYKRNPMRTERICSLSRIVQSQQSVIAQTAATQWLERTLDDSACRRIAIPEAFMGVDAILTIYYDVISGAVVHPERIRTNLNAELPFMATELIIMELVKRGGDRQKAHEAIREHAMATRKEMDAGTSVNNLIERLAKDPLFEPVKDDMKGWIQPERFAGAAPMQVDDFLQNELRPALESAESEVPQVVFESLKV